LFILLVSAIGFSTNIYSFNYFRFEERGEDFILLINWFIVSMLFLVVANNFFTLILGWELIGLTSFLLINFWKFKLTTLSCSFKAFIFNKISDVFLIVAFCILWNTYKINNIDVLLTYISFNPNTNQRALFSTCICLILCASIKSAQIIGHLWLPDSMEAPVPASALIHSATLVSAGIFILLKFHSLFLYTNLLPVIFFIGSITACYGGVVASAQSDMKKLLAYSTISHCGFLFASIAFNNFVITIIYLYLHGIFKALTFFAAGSIIKYNSTQDMRGMGGITNQRLDCIFLIISASNLGGLPFTFGYLYKELFLNYLVINYFYLISYGFLIIGMLTSIIYVFKLIYYSCFDYRKGHLDWFPYLVQNNKNPEKIKYNNTNYAKVISFYVLYLFSIIFYFIVKVFILENYLFYYYTPETSVNNYNYLTEAIMNHKHLIKIYYSLYLLTIYILLCWGWRTNYFYLENHQGITCVVQFFLFYFFTHKLTSLGINFLDKYIVIPAFYNLEIYIVD